MSIAHAFAAGQLAANRTERLEAGAFDADVEARATRRRAIARAARIILGVRTERPARTYTERGRHLAPRPV
ncbi:hypothetical protein ET445_09620 [Agromyces protaetiae]|uniref:Uncharacterized protein n=1 Tax=Agromyces protaetiae TaxID=2509455 RepID=A0A4P6FGI0_9MICO|nr:hypothetical protein [Agromyces protaetiae]QAY73559.1 hypothetical protein ET445_09620 [Agromyces protaetiae]